MAQTNDRRRDFEDELEEGCLRACILDACEVIYDSCGHHFNYILRIGFRLLGPCLVGSYYWLMCYHTWVFLTIIAPVLRKRVGGEFATVWTLVGIIITFNQVWNHVLAMCLRPGSPKDLIVSRTITPINHLSDRDINFSLVLQRIEKLRKKLKNRESKSEWDSGRSSQPISMINNSERIEGVSSQVKSLMKYRHKTVEDLRRIWTRHCKTCNEIKPARTSHCQMCNECVFSMDHHCPWVNNCLGAWNYRYFLLYITYLGVGSAWYGLTIIAIWDHWIYVSQHDFMLKSFSCLQEYQNSHLNWLLLMNFFLFFVIMMFIVWQWYLAFSGTTTIEFWKYHSSYVTVPFDFSFDLVRDNLFNIFGTYKLIRQFSPSLRQPPLTGLEWSFLLKELGIEEDGEVTIEDGRSRVEESGAVEDDENRDSGSDYGQSRNDEIEMS